MANGVWEDQRIEFAGAGSPEQPITLRAQTAGQVILTGRSRLNISGDHLVVDGLRFEDGALERGEHVVSFRGSLGMANNSRLTNSSIRRYNPARSDTRYFWVSLWGRDNRVDHNLFEGHNHSGVTVVVWRDGDRPDHHRIDANHFLDRLPGEGNGFETIRVGTGNTAHSNSYTMVEFNLFERVDGEIEIISSKSGGNVYRYNTFRESAGTLTLRSGNDNVVEGNFFLGMGKRKSGGVRVTGERHLIVNNYFMGLDGSAGGAISISAGTVEGVRPEYPRVKDVVIAHNTIVEVDRAAVSLAHGRGKPGRSLLAERVAFVNNLTWSSGAPLFKGDEGRGWVWGGNIAFGHSLGSALDRPGIVVVDPQLERSADGLFRPSARSPVIDRAVAGHGKSVDEDMDGQVRDGRFDIGADELSAARVVRRPLSAGDVGPSWSVLGGSFGAAAR